VTTPRFLCESCGALIPANKKGLLFRHAQKNGERCECRTVVLPGQGALFDAEDKVGKDLGLKDLVTSSEFPRANIGSCGEATKLGG